MDWRDPTDPPSTDTINRDAVAFALRSRAQRRPRQHYAAPTAGRTSTTSENLQQSDCASRVAVLTASRSAVWNQIPTQSTPSLLKWSGSRCRRSPKVGSRTSHEFFYADPDRHLASRSRSTHGDWSSSSYALRRPPRHRRRATATGLAHRHRQRARIHQRVNPTDQEESHACSEPPHEQLPSLQCPTTARYPPQRRSRRPRSQSRSSARAGGRLPPSRTTRVTPTAPQYASALISGLTTAQSRLPRRRRHNRACRGSFTLWLRLGRRTPSLGVPNQRRRVVAGAPRRSSAHRERRRRSGAAHVGQRLWTGRLTSTPRIRGSGVPAGSSATLFGKAIPRRAWCSSGAITRSGWQRAG